MIKSISLLGAQGDLEWDLPVDWMVFHDDSESESDMDSDDLDSSDEEREDLDLGIGSGNDDLPSDFGESGSDDDDLQSDDTDRGSRDDDLQGKNGDGVRAQGGQGMEESSGEESDEPDDLEELESMIGHFAFFLADECPVLVFKAQRVEERGGEMGYVGQWWTPAKSTLRGDAASVAFEDYCNTRVTFTPDFVLKPSSTGGRATRVPDVGWERKDRVVVWSKKKELNGKGKKIPKQVVDAVSRAFEERRSKGEGAQTPK